MSYILNALRKSEQERLAQQPDNVTGRILVNQPQPRHKSSKLIILLIISNLIAAAGFFWFIRKESAPTLSVAANKTVTPEKMQIKPVVVPPIKMVSPSKPLIKKSELTLPSIAKIAVSGKVQAPEFTAIKPEAEKNTAQVQRKTEIIPVEPKSITATPVEPVKMVEKKPEAAAESKAIPFLFELDPEFRRTVPEFKINVFVYSAQPSDRFVMIDMVKYTVGEQIKESVTLKEIRSDSLVVAYNNHVFRIKRP